MNDPAEDRPLNILCFGAGAIGTYIGGSLALDGHQVVFIEAPSAVEQLVNQGISLETAGVVRKIDQPRVVPTLDLALTYGPFDAAIFALKSFDTRPAIEGLGADRDKFPPILCLQNGVDNELYLGSVLGRDNVIAGTVTSAVGRRGVGNIVLERLRGVGIAGDHTLAPWLVRAFNHAGLNAQLFQSASEMKWSKLLTNLPANASSAILNKTPAEIFADPDLFRLEITQLRETLAVMDQQKIKVVDLPGTPVRLFAFAIRRLPLGLSRLVLRRAIGGGRGGKMPSFHIDLYNRRGKSEVVYLNGAVADYGERNQVLTPVNQFFSDTLMALTMGILPIDTYAQQPQKLLAEFERCRRLYYSTTP